MALNEHIEKLNASTSLKRLFRNTPTIEFVAPLERCICCATVLQVYKTQKSTVATLMIGTFRARETILYCQGCGKVYASEELRALKPYRCRFGYDVIVDVGKAMFMHSGNEADIQRELAKRRVRISEREVSFLAKKFIVYLSIAHKQSQQRIQELLSRNGGYILHLDATCEGESPHLMCGVDGITEIVLENAKMSSEKAETIIPFLKKVQQSYGNPLATVHDMGKGICRAVRSVFPNIPDFICHYHFLAAVGKNLLKKENNTLRSRLRTHGIQGKLRRRARELKSRVEKNPALVNSLLKSLEQKRLTECALKFMPAVVTYALVVWSLAGKKEGDGYGFPFDRSYLSFYNRLKVLQLVLKELKAVRLTDKKKDNKPYLTVYRDLLDTMSDATLRRAAAHMKQKAFLFDKLRTAMRIVLPGEKQGLNDTGSNEQMTTIAQRVKKFCRWVENDKLLSQKQEYKHVIGQVRKYWEKLFCDPLTVTTPESVFQIQPQRTNNILERCFRLWKRMYRKKSGMNGLERIMKSIAADTPLVQNLHNPRYMNILLNGKLSLDKRFAEIDDQLVQRELTKLSVNSDRVPWGIKKMIKQVDLPEQLAAILAGK